MAVPDFLHLEATSPVGSRVAEEPGGYAYGHAVAPVRPPFAGAGGGGGTRAGADDVGRRRRRHLRAARAVSDLGGWWDHQRWSREEWDVAVASGELYRLSHQPEGWFVEGVYD